MEFHHLQNQPCKLNSIYIFTSKHRLSTGTIPIHSYRIRFIRISLLSSHYGEGQAETPICKNVDCVLEFFEIKEYYINAEIEEDKNDSEEADTNNNGHLCHDTLF